MNNLQDLYQSELKNLYALEKQISSTMEIIGDVKHEKLLKRLNQFIESNRSDFENIKKILQKESLNPGSTTDSVANEILTNLENESKSTIKSTVKEAGIVASLNRLASYKVCNYENAYRLAKTLKSKKAKKKLKKIMKANRKHADKFLKLAFKSLYGEAL